MATTAAYRRFRPGDGDRFDVSTGDGPNATFGGMKPF